MTTLRPKHWGQIDPEIRKLMIDAANAVMNSNPKNKSFWGDLISESNANILLSRLG